MQLNKQQVEMALGAGLELLGEKSEIVVPVKLNDGIFLLKQLLLSIANGQLGLAPTTQKESGDDPQDPAIPPKQPGTPTPKKRAANRKKRTKKVSKKK